MRRRAATMLPRVLALVAATGCSAGLYPRPADVARPGRATFMMHQAYAAIAPAAATVTGATGIAEDSQSVTGNGASPLGRQVSMIAWGPLVGIEGRLGIGIFDPCEVGVIAGISRLAGELRCAIASAEDGGAAVALSGAFGYEPFFSHDGWWGRAAVDVSTPRAPWRLVLGAAVTYGPEAYSLAVEADPDFALPDDALEAYAQLRRDEARLSLAIGVAFSGASPNAFTVIDGIEFRRYKGTTYVLGLVPHVTLATADERRTCEGCAGGTVGRFDVGFGASIVVGVGWFDPSGIPSPFAPERTRIE